MVRITINKHGFTSEGHSEYAEEGKDIVCSAISVLTQTITWGLAKYCKACGEQRKGFISVKINEINETSKVLLKTLLFGLQQIQKEYPEQLTIKEESKYE